MGGAAALGGGQGQAQANGTAGQGARTGEIVGEGQQLLEEDRDRLKQMEQLVKAKEQVR